MLPRRSKEEVDGYTHFLIRFAKDEFSEVDVLTEKLVNMKDGLQALNPKFLSYEEQPSWDDITLRFRIILMDLKSLRKNRMRDQLLRARLALYDVIGRSLIVCSRVLQIIEVAELRRTALGFRFININHLIWAFYECGFGLPLEIRDKLDLPVAEEDHPPYIIYLTSKNLATSFGFPVGRDGEKKLELEHFVFSILYAKDVLVEENQVKEMEEHFKTFMEVVALDALQRARPVY